MLAGYAVRQPEPGIFDDWKVIRWVGSGKLIIPLAVLMYISKHHYQQEEIMKRRSYKRRLNESNNLPGLNLHWRAIAFGVAVGAGITYCLAVLFKIL